MESVGKLLLVIGGVVALVGLGLLVAGWLGLERLPGDLVLRRGNLTVYAPIGLMILLSVIGTIVLNLISRR